MSRAKTGDGSPSSRRPFREFGRFFLAQASSTAVQGQRGGLARNQPYCVQPCRGSPGSQSSRTVCAETQACSRLDVTSCPTENVPMPLFRRVSSSGPFLSSSVARTHQRSVVDVFFSWGQPKLAPTGSSRRICIVANGLLTVKTQWKPTKSATQGGTRMPDLQEHMRSDRAEQDGIARLRLITRRS